jgi:hypothetical protein
LTLSFAIFFFNVVFKGADTLLDEVTNHKGGIHAESE